MSDFVENNSVTVAARADRPEAYGEAALISGYRTLEEYLARAEKIYQRTKDDFFALGMIDERLLDAADRWREAGVALMRWAASYYRKLNSTDEERDYALKLMDRVTKDSGTRCDNVSRYYDLLEMKTPDDLKNLRIAEKADLKHLETLSRMIETQQMYIRREENAAGHMDREQRMMAEASKGIRETYDRIPEGHTYRPAYPYPPMPIPEGEPVPDLPDPIQRVEDVPLSEKDYDENLDEFVLKKGYVSEDKLIDDQSLVYHPETHEVEFGYVGGVRARWKYWKAGDDRDVPDPNSWAVNYFQRYYAQYVLAPEYDILNPQTDEGEIPEYNRIPIQGTGRLE